VIFYSYVSLPEGNFQVICEAKQHGSVRLTRKAWDDPENIWGTATAPQSAEAP
jgi:hypothetical protein